jgi:hypothetical protein
MTQRFLSEDDYEIYQTVRLLRLFWRGTPLKPRAASIQRNSQREYGPWRIQPVAEPPLTRGGSAVLEL